MHQIYAIKKNFRDYDENEQQVFLNNRILFYHESFETAYAHQTEIIQKDPDAAEGNELILVDEYGRKTTHPLYHISSYQVLN